MEKERRMDEEGYNKHAEDREWADADTVEGGSTTVLEHIANNGPSAQDFTKVDIWGAEHAAYMQEKVNQNGQPPPPPPGRSQRRVMNGEGPPQPNWNTTYVSNPVPDPDYNNVLPDDPLEVIQRPIKLRRLDSSLESVDDASNSEDNQETSEDDDDYNDSPGEWKYPCFEGYKWCWHEENTNQYWQWNSATRKWYVCEIDKTWWTRSCAKRTADSRKYTRDDRDEWTDAGNQYGAINHRHPCNSRRDGQNSYSSNSRGLENHNRW